MKIAVISTPVFPIPCTGYAGLEVVAYHCAKGLAEKGHTVTVVAPSGSHVPGCRVVECGPAGHWNEEAFYGGWKREEGGKVLQWGGYWPVLLEQDVIIDHTWSKFSYMLKAEGRLKVPLLGVLHAPVKTMYNTLPPVEKPCMVCISVDQANQFREIHEPADCRVVYNGIYLEQYKPFNVPRTDRFLFLARFSTIKGPDIAIRACKEAGVGLDLVGDTSITQEPALFEYCTREADGKQIRLIGPCTRGNTVFWYNQAHCLLHPNKHFREPFGLAPMEAMACGCPVIAWDRGACRETIKQGVTGWLVKSEQELVERIREVRQGIPDGMRQWCVEWARKFSIDYMVSRYEELCEEAIQTGGW